MGKVLPLLRVNSTQLTDTDDFYIDLIFYKYRMKRFVIFELKTHKLTHRDIGQPDMHVRMYNDLIKGTDNTTVHYSLDFITFLLHHIAQKSYEVRSSLGNFVLPYSNFDSIYGQMPLQGIETTALRL